MTRFDAAMTRRQLLGGMAMLAAPGLTVAARGNVSDAMVKPSWSSLAESYTYPTWFRDAKFGIWSHWGPQCVPEAGDWYGRLMYIQGTPQYEHHVRTYGHPSKTGFLDIIGRWKAENWQPEYLTRLFKKAGARYIVSMANHHDNVDTFDSSHHAWNTLNIGPRKDIVGTWEKAVRAAGLRFGVSNHGGHAWHWYQTAYAYDAEGLYAGRRYDAYNLTRADGKGTWWDGLDPQELYTGRHMVPPDGIASIADMQAWHDRNSGQWVEHGPDDGGAYVANWLARQKELVEKYKPDLVYLDNYGLPFGKAGLSAAAHYYNQALTWHGSTDVAMTAKRLAPDQKAGLMEDVERGFIDHIAEHPWQTCTCIGQWHYDRTLYERKGYKSAHMVVQRLLDAVSKNGNLLLSVPMRGDGTIDSEEVKILAELADWMAVNGDAIYGSRPWRQYGHGPAHLGTGLHSEGKSDSFTSADVRYVKRGSTLYAACLDWPSSSVVLTALNKADMPHARVEKVCLMDGRPVAFRHRPEGLSLNLPQQKGPVPVPVVKIEGHALV